MSDNLLQRVSINSNICFGQPCLRGKRIWVGLLVENLAADASEEEILNPYPALTADDIKAALTYADQRARP